MSIGLLLQAFGRVVEQSQVKGIVLLEAAVTPPKPL